jgi:molybdenum-dependent DNA-binding transcriptional regulator ModE
MKKTKKVRFNHNGREVTAKARERVLKAAKKRGSITHAQARVIGKWDQAWYHLNAMCEAGLLKKGKFNEWRPRK